MARLSISLLGTFEVLLAGRPVTTFESDKGRSLLAYLTVESDRPHRREMLAGLLWPRQSERSARHSLSQALFNLRQVLNDRGANPPLLTVTPRTLQCNLASDWTLDVAQFTTFLAAGRSGRQRQPHTVSPRLADLQQAVALYRGRFLEGFSLDDSTSFEEWLVLNRERLHRLAVDACRELAQRHEQRSGIRQALYYARRRVELAPWQEDGHHHLMRLLVRHNQPEEALAQYEECRRILMTELGVEEPPEKTRQLYRQIQTGKLPYDSIGDSPSAVLPFSVPPKQAIKGHSNPEIGDVCARALELAQAIGERSQAAQITQAIPYFESVQDRQQTFLYGFEPWIICQAALAWVLWLLGYPEQAYTQSDKAITLAQQLGHPWSLTTAHIYAAILHLFRREAQTAEILADRCIKLCNEYKFQYWLSVSLFCQGWALAEQGQTETGAVQIEKAINYNQSAGSKLVLPLNYAILAQVYGKLGREQEAFNLLDIALEIARSPDERFYEAEIHRLRGETGQKSGLSSIEVELHFQQAVAVARAQQAKSWELRATISLCRLWQQQGKMTEARQTLSNVYSWFREGFDIPDLQAAEALLKELC